MHTSYEAPGADLGTVVIRIEGELDAFAAPDLKQQLFACLDSGFNRLILEMSACTFVDSTGLGVLVAALKHARGRELALAGPNPEIRRILQVVGLDRVLPLYDSPSEALRHR
jgi:anti-sigma B factor antagonist